jgi:nucleotide-binding universal stress UspA family protein
MAKQILVPIDDSPRASAILAQLSLVCDRRDQILLISVAEPPGGPRNAAALVHQRKELQAFLETKADALRERGFRVRTEAILHKDPSRAIIDYARKTRPNLIAMVRRTHDPRRFIFGSVTSDVVKSDVAPVVLLPPGPAR